MRHLARGIVLLVAVCVSTAQAQAGSTRAIVGTARDSATGAPLPRSLVCTYLPTGPSAFLSRCARVDANGDFRLDSLRLDMTVFWLACAVTRGLVGRYLAQDTLPPGDTSTVRRAWTVSTVGCDHRPIREVTRTFAGHYTPGFESSEFIPCPGSVWVLPEDSLGTGPSRAWVTWPLALRTDTSFVWPDAPKDAWGNSTYYVRWRGTMVGPGRYGHLGGSPFEFRLDTVFEIKRPSPKDCR